MLYYASFFFFQAEDGIRDATVTGVQTCALPISPSSRPSNSAASEFPNPTTRALGVGNSLAALLLGRDDGAYYRTAGAELLVEPRSEERRVGKECRSR